MAAETRTSKVKGRDELIRRMKKRFGTKLISAQIGTRSTSGSTSGGGVIEWTGDDGGKHRDYLAPTRIPGRSAGQNIIILRMQAKRGRNPVHTTKAEDASIQRIWTRYINKFMAGDDSAIQAGAKRVAQAILSNILEHIKQGKHIRGKMRPLKGKSASKKKVGWGDKPVLEASGQVAESLYADFKVIK